MTGERSGVFDRFPGCLEQQPVLRVDGGRFALSEAEERGVETADVVDEATPPRDRPARYPPLGVVVVLDDPPVGGDLGHQVVAAQQRLPKRVGRVDPPGKTASHPDDRNGGNR